MFDAQGCALAWGISGTAGLHCTTTPPCTARHSWQKVAGFALRAQLRVRAWQERRLRDSSDVWALPACMQTMHNLENSSWKCTYHVDCGCGAQEGAGDGSPSEDEQAVLLRRRSSYHLTSGHAAVELFLRLNHARQTVDFARRQVRRRRGAECVLGWGVGEGLASLW